MSNNKPNIIVIMSDEHTWNITGCYENDIVKTPNLDRLAEQGTVFENCYTPSPLCVPARLAFTAGKYISRCGAWGNESELPEEFPSLPRVIGKAGYKSYLIGKMHYRKDRRYGFIDEHAEFNQTKASGKIKRINIEDENYESVDFLSERFKRFAIGDSSVLQHDRQVTQYCTDFLRNRKRQDAPFLMLAGYLAPHFPIIVPEEYHAMYKDKVPMPEVPEGHVETLPKNYEVLRKAFGYTNVPEEIVKFGRELYYGFVSWLDCEIGKLLHALEDSVVTDNTIVIYTSDHGENLGEHGMWWKNNMYETSTHIPCIVSWPGKWGAGQRRTEVCGLLDVVKTITEVCGAEAPEDWDGNSLVPFLNGRDGEWENITVSEYYAHNVAAGQCMIRKDNCKYVYVNKINDRHDEEYQLFDLAKDPKEMQNLAYVDAYQDLRKELHALLVKEIGREPFECEKEVQQLVEYKTL